MRRFFFSLIGISLILASIAGLIISVTGIIGVWRIEKALIKNTDTTLELLETTLQTTADGISIASNSLDQATQALDSVILTIETTGKSVQESIPLLSALSKVTVESIPETIVETQKALQSAQTSAKMIDTTLSILTSIPFLPVEPYSTQTPLSDALKDVSDSLAPISQSLSSMDQSLKRSQENLNTIEAKFGQIATSLQSIGTGLRQARNVTQQYLDVVSTLQQQLRDTRRRLPGDLGAVAWFITIALVWLGFTQIGLMMQGLEMMGLHFLHSEKNAAP